MNNISFGKLLIKTLIGIILLLFSLTIFMSFQYTLEINLVDFIFESFYFAFILICLYLSLELKNKWMNLGLILISISFISDALDEVKFISLNTEWSYILNLVFEKTSLFIGIIIISYGLYINALQQKRLINDLKDMATNDSLTSLPNRGFIVNQLSSLINDSYSKSSLIGVMFIDLDNFKLINDTFGHSFGDILLKKTARKLQDSIDDKCIIGRMSGDEFVIIAHDIYSLDIVENLAKRIISKFKVPLHINDTPVHISCSIGISTFPYDGCSVDTLIKNADLGMYKAKKQGKNSYSFYDNAMGKSAFEKFDMSESIRRALMKNEFVLYYQPKVSIKDNKILGFEALIRWNHPELGLIYPNDFIPIAEELGLIKRIDEHVLKLACLQIKDWDSKGFSPLNVSVNISAQLFNQANLVQKIDSVLREIQINPSNLHIEITETLAIKDIEHTYEVLEELRSMGIKILLDDFGKGYSSLNYLKSLPIDIIKIDRFFINGISTSRKDEALIEAIITMAKAIDLQVIAEGVENTEQLEFLDKLGCKGYQGYFFSKPIPSKEIEEKFFKITERVK